MLFHFKFLWAVINLSLCKGKVVIILVVLLIEGVWPLLVKEGTSTSTPLTTKTIPTKENGCSGLFNIVCPSSLILLILPTIRYVFY